MAVGRRRCASGLNLTLDTRAVGWSQRIHPNRGTHESTRFHDVCGQLGRAAQNAAAKVYRIGSLNSAGPADKSPYGPLLIRSLAQHGYVLGKNITFVHHGAEMQLNRLPQLVDELRASKVDVVFALGYPAALAMKGTAIPVVSYTTGDPVGTGLVESLARPGGNITGISDVSAK
jgi:ABC transporter substrate binding protein